MATIDQLAAELHADALSLRRRGFGAEGDRIGEIADAITRAIEPIRLVSEHTAMVRSGKRRAWLIERFEGWRKVGAAVMVNGERHYRLCVLPLRLAADEGAADAERLLGRGA